MHQQIATRLALQLAALALLAAMIFSLIVNQG